MAISAALLKKLVQIPIFQGLTVPEAAEFFEVADERTFTKGSKLFTEGDGGDALFVVLDGEVRIIKRGVELATVGQHAILGEMCLLHADARSASAEALTQVTCLSLPSKRIQKLLKSERLSALKIAANLAQVLSKRLALINERFVESKGSKRQELADFGKILNRWTF